MLLKIKHKWQYLQQLAAAKTLGYLMISGMFAMWTKENKEKQDKFQFKLL